MPAPNKKVAKERKITIKEVAKKAEVSVATVSYVMNNSGSVSPSVRKKVQRIAHKMGYSPNHSARVMRTGKTKTLGLILPNLCNPFFPELAQSIESSARKSGYSVVLIDTQDNKNVEAEGIKRFLHDGVEGIIWCPTTDGNSLNDIIRNTPIVVVDRPLPDFDFVCADYTHGGRLIAQYLHQKKHHSIGLISGPSNLSSARERRDGFVREMKSHSVLEWELENDFSVQLSSQVKKKLADMGEQASPSAIVCGNDLIAIGVMRELRSLGRDIPEDISVIGFDDIPWSDIVTPELTTIRQPISELGSEAINLLLRRIEDSDSSKKQLTLSVSLVERRSVRDTPNGK